MPSWLPTGLKPSSFRPTFRPKSCQSKAHDLCSSTQTSRPI